MVSDFFLIHISAKKVFSQNPYQYFRDLFRLRMEKALYENSFHLIVGRYCNNLQKSRDDEADLQTFGIVNLILSYAGV
jgi:hypothetical protein